MKLLETSKVTLTSYQTNSSIEFWRLLKRIPSQLMTEADLLSVQETPNWTIFMVKLWTTHLTWLTSNSQKSWPTEWRLITSSKSLLMACTQWKIPTSPFQETLIAWRIWFLTLKCNAVNSVTIVSSTSSIWLENARVSSVKELLMLLSTESPELVTKNDLSTLVKFI